MTREEALEESRRKLEDLCSTMSAEDFVRVVTKFFTAVVVTEEHFKRRFPAEYELWSREYYGEDVS